jgi:hypothetical protein
MVKVRVIKHLTPFQFKGVDVISIAGKMMGEITDIPFLEEEVEASDVTVTAEKYQTMGGVVPDEVHLFNPPGGTDGSFTARQFQFSKGRLEEVTMGIDPDYLDQVARKVRNGRF